MIRFILASRKVLDVSSQRCKSCPLQIPTVFSRNMITKRPKSMDKGRNPQKNYTYPDEKKVTPFGWFLLVIEIDCPSLDIVFIF